MHTDWLDYINTQHMTAHTTATAQAFIAPLTHLAVLAVTGSDAATFLQGQTTCDIKALVDSKPHLGAYCNAKGRTISTFIIIKQQDNFMLILSRELLDSVRKKLQMYVLRADVQLTDTTDQLCITGTHNINIENQDNIYPYPQLENSFLFIASAEQSITFCTQLTQQQDVILTDHNSWLALDIQAGIPWIGQQTTEEFVPQMLNLDKLGAISFEKGCYTGQEIVARTHYLGKNKRAMYQAISITESNIIPGDTVSDADEESNQLGTVILVSKQHTETQLLVVLKDQACEVKNLQLNNANHDKITLHKV